MAILQSIPLAAMIAIIAATIWRGISVRRQTGDHPLAFLDAKGIQRVAGLSFAISTAILIAASFLASNNEATAVTLPAAIVAVAGAAMVIVAQIQMGRAWRIGVREGDAPQFVSHGLFRLSRNPIFVGMMLVGLAAAIVAGSWWAWAAIIIFILSCIGQVRIEEVHLEASFGAAYNAFRAKVPRWLGFGGRT